MLTFLCRLHQSATIIHHALVLPKDPKLHKYQTRRKARYIGAVMAQNSEKLLSTLDVLQAFLHRNHCLPSPIQTQGSCGICLVDLVSHAFSPVSPLLHVVRAPSEPTAPYIHLLQLAKTPEEIRTYVDEYLDFVLAM